MSQDETGTALQQLAPLGEAAPAMPDLAVAGLPYLAGICWRVDDVRGCEQPSPQRH